MKHLDFKTYMKQWEDAAANSAGGGGVAGIGVGPQGEPGLTPDQIKKHKKKVESPNAPAPAPFDCAICNVTITGEAQYNAHLEGKKHKKKLENPNKSSENQSTKFQCELCSVEILGEDQYKKHLEGKKHKATLDKTQNPVPTQQFRCETKISSSPFKFI